jgi:hypothetical protein
MLSIAVPLAVTLHLSAPGRTSHAFVSKLFRDQELQACLLSDAHHVASGVQGDHVGKIQQAMIAASLVLTRVAPVAIRYGRMYFREMSGMEGLWSLCRRRRCRGLRCRKRMGFGKLIPGPDLQGSGPLGDEPYFQ